MKTKMEQLTAISITTILTLIFFSVPRVDAQVMGPQQTTTGPEPPKEVIERDAQKPFVVAAAIETTLIVPGYNWRHGCGPTAVGMVVGYFDGLDGYDLIPGDASTQTAAVDQAIASGGDSSSPNPPGSEQHYEDYAVPRDYAPDPLLDDDYITAMRTPHADDCIADYMDTSKSTRGNYYGWSWVSDLGPSFVSYVNQQNPAYSPSYSDYYMGSSLTWSVLTNEIDNGYPMVFVVDIGGDGITDHAVTVIGYRVTDTSTQQYGCLDTWNGSTVRWENFQQMADGVPWGVYCGFSFSATALSLPIAVDIKPTSCPNPLNVKSKGVLPVAILGTEDFDVYDVSWAILEGIPPIKIDYYDATTPIGDDAEECECNEAGPDGYMDLVLYFDTQEIVTALGPVADRDVLELILMGEDVDGISIEGSDCIRIIKKGQN